MGMFDYIRTQMPLPSDPKPPTIEWFQTKDVPTVQHHMEKWTIRADGMLIKHGVRYEDRSNPKAELGTLERLRGMITPVPVPEDDQEMPYHGDIEFYHRGKGGDWWNYVARFTEGRCARIWCSEHELAKSVPHRPL